MGGKIGLVLITLRQSSGTVLLNKTVIIFLLYRSVGTAWFGSFVTQGPWNYSYRSYIFVARGGISERARICLVIFPYYTTSQLVYSIFLFTFCGVNTVPYTFCVYVPYQGVRINSPSSDSYKITSSQFLKVMPWVSSQNQSGFVRPRTDLRLRV